MWVIAALMIGLSTVAAIAQPADCASTPGPAGVLPLAIDLGGRPGVPPGLTGQAYIGVPVQAQGGLECGGVPPGPRDILHGPPGDVLQGPPAANLLRGSGAPVVRMEPVPPSGG